MGNGQPPAGREGPLGRPPRGSLGVLCGRGPDRGSPCGEGGKAPPAPDVPSGCFRCVCVWGAFEGIGGGVGEMVTGICVLRWWLHG